MIEIERIVDVVVQPRDSRDVQRKNEGGMAIFPLVGVPIQATLTIQGDSEEMTGVLFWDALEQLYPENEWELLDYGAF